MNSTIYMIKSIPTKDSQFPLLLKCFEMEFGPQKSRVLVPLYPLLSLSRLPIFSFGQEGCCEQILYDMGEILKNFAHLKNILCPYTLQLVTRRRPEDFLILSPVLWNLKLFEVCPGSHKNCFFGVISHNLWRNLETNLERITSKGRCGYFLELHSGFIYCLREGRGDCGGVRSDIQERSQVVFNW